MDATSRTSFLQVWFTFLFFFFFFQAEDGIRDYKVTEFRRVLFRSRWLAAPLHDWATELLDPARLAEGGVFDPTAVAALWRGCRTRPGSGAHLLWAVLMFEAWRRTWRATI